MRRSILSIILLVVLLSGCSCVKYLCEKVQYWRYSYGEQGEFWYLQTNGRESARYYELARKWMKESLGGGMKSWKYESSEKDVLLESGRPQDVTKYVGVDGAHYNEWYYNFYILVFKEGKLVNVKSTGKNPLKEYIWLETDYVK